MLYKLEALLVTSKCSLHMYVVVYKGNYFTDRHSYTDLVTPRYTRSLNVERAFINA